MPFVWWVTAPPEQSRPLALRANIFVSALLGAGAVLVLAGCGHSLLRISAVATPIARILTLAAGLVGVPCAVWLCVCAFWFVRGRKTGFYTLLSFCLYPVWLCLRAVSVFSRAPVNANDSVTLAALFCPVVLAYGWFCLLGALANGGRTDKAFYPALLACVLLSVCVGLPTALVCARSGDAAACAFFLADAFCGAAAALFAADTRPSRKGASADAQQ